MEQIGSAADSSRRKSVFAHDTPAPDNAHIRTELVLMQRKYERLAQKEKRMMVGSESDVSSGLRRAVWL